MENILAYSRIILNGGMARTVFGRMQTRIHEIVGRVAQALVSTDMNVKTDSPIRCSLSKGELTI